MTDDRKTRTIREITQLVTAANTIIEEGGTVEMELAAIQRALGLNDLLLVKYRDPGVQVHWDGGMWAIGAVAPATEEVYCD